MYSESPWVRPGAKVDTIPHEKLGQIVIFVTGTEKPWAAPGRCCQRVMRDCHSVITRGYERHWVDS